MQINTDQLNTPIQNEDEQRHTPYEEYFGDMELPESEKRDRISMANELDSEILFILSLIAVSSQYGSVDRLDMAGQLNDRYKGVVGRYMDIDDYLADYIYLFSADTVDVTLRHLADPYYTSLDRAMYVSENETNTTMNYRQFLKAMLAGKTQKTWVDIRDKRERKTHRKVGRKTIAITDTFLVGDSLMLFPKDTSLGAEAKEIVNCRCSVKYT